MKTKLLLALGIFGLFSTTGCQALKQLSDVGLQVSVVDGEAKAQLGPLKLDLDILPDEPIE